MDNYKITHILNTLNDKEQELLAAINQIDNDIHSLLLAATGLNEELGALRVDLATKQKRLEGILESKKSFLELLKGNKHVL